MRDVSQQPDYINTGYSPVTVVSIPDAGLEFTTTLKNSGVIVRTSKPFGGYEEVATLNISNLELGEDLSLTTSATIDRYDDHATLRGTGQVSSAGLSGNPYESSRDAITGALSDASITVGQQFQGGLLRYTATRGYLQYQIPAMTSLEEATLYLPGLNKFSLVDFDIVAVLGTWDSLTTGLFNDFAGWQVIGDYTDDITQLNEPFSTSEFFVFDGSQADEDDQYVHIRFNKAGRDAILAAAGGVIRIMLLSKNDVESAAPTGDEFVLFTASTTTLRLRYNTQKLNNKPVNVYRYYGERPAAFTDMLELFRGVVKSHRISLRTLDLEIRRDEGSVNIVLPKTVITEEEFTDVPNDNKGLPLPIVYGDFETTVENTLKLGSILNETDTNNRYGDGSFLRSIVVRDIGTVLTMILAGHTMKSIGFFAAVWESGASSYAPITGDILEVSDGQYRIDKGDPNDFPYSLTDNKDGLTNIQPISVKGATGFNFGLVVTDPENAINKDALDWSTFTEADIVEYEFGQPWGSGTLYDSMYVTIETEVDSYVTDKLQLTVIYNNEQNESDTFTVSIESNGQTVFEINEDLPGFDKIPASSVVKLIVSIRAFSGAVFPIRYRNVCVSRGYSLDTPNTIFMRGQGKPDDGSGTVTGTPGELIENPSHAIESVARSEMGLVTSDLNTTDLDDAATNLPSWLTAFQWNEAKRGIDRFDKIGEECKLNIFRDELNRLTAKVWLESLPFAHSGTDIPDDLDIFQESAAISGDVVTKNPILKDSFSLDQTDLRRVYNSFELHFNRNYATGGYRDVITIDNGLGVPGDVETTLTDTDEESLEFDQTILGLQDLTASSYLSTQSITNQMIFRAEHIRDRATAVKLLQHLIESFSPVRHIITLTTRENAVWIEFGDRVNIRHRRVDQVFGAPTAKRKKWALYRIRHNLGTTHMTFSFIEVKVEL